jgi:hypothetical protein
MSFTHATAGWEDHTDKAMQDLAAGSLVTAQAQVEEIQSRLAMARAEARKRDLLNAAKLLFDAKKLEENQYEAFAAYLDMLGIDAVDRGEDNITAVSESLPDLNFEQRKKISSFLRPLPAKTFLRLTAVPDPPAPLAPPAPAPASAPAPPPAAVTPASGKSGDNTSQLELLPEDHTDAFGNTTRAVYRFEKTGQLVLKDSAGPSCVPGNASIEDIVKVCQLMWKLGVSAADIATENGHACDGYYTPSNMWSSRIPFPAKRCLRCEKKILDSLYTTCHNCKVAVMHVAIRHDAPEHHTKETPADFQYVIGCGCVVHTESGQCEFWCDDCFSMYEEGKQDSTAVGATDGKLADRELSSHETLSALTEALTHALPSQYTDRLGNTTDVVYVTPHGQQVCRDTPVRIIKSGRASQADIINVSEAMLKLGVSLVDICVADGHALDGYTSPKYDDEEQQQRSERTVPFPAMRCIGCELKVRDSLYTKCHCCRDAIIHVKEADESDNLPETFKYTGKCAAHMSRGDFGDKHEFWCHACQQAYWGLMPPSP